MRSRGRQYVIGIDEVGRGPIAGPLCVGACLVCRRDVRRLYRTVRGVRDSKRLSPAQRERWQKRIREEERAGRLVSVTAFVSHAVIDRLGMGAALRRGIGRCLRKLTVSPLEARVLLDGGIRAPRQYIHQETIIGGDEQEPLIALASIAAKVRRDRHMARLTRRFPEYGFEVHKGYGTRGHYEALRKHGISPVHRRSFLRNFVNQ